jgi:hypothetical protein
MDTLKKETKGLVEQGVKDYFQSFKLEVRD